MKALKAIEIPIALNIATKEAIDEDRSKRKHISRWKRRALAGLGALALLTLTGTNKTLHREIGGFEWMVRVHKSIPLWEIDGGISSDLVGYMYGGVSYNHNHYSAHTYFGIRSGEISSKVIKITSRKGFWGSSWKTLVDE